MNINAKIMRNNGVFVRFTRASLCRKFNHVLYIFWLRLRGNMRKLAKAEDQAAVLWWVWYATSSEQCWNVVSSSTMVDKLQFCEILTSDKKTDAGVWFKGLMTWRKIKKSRLESSKIFNCKRMPFGVQRLCYLSVGQISLASIEWSNSSGQY